ncbi:hypothetical protein B0H14DRAFT_3457454 [Mycena olivaceomarginata]|nr:hypothetical protein B0H14DRAFT_3457454 [Mycena olivaceomarginata]
MHTRCTITTPATGADAALLHATRYTLPLLALALLHATATRARAATRYRYSLLLHATCACAANLRHTATRYCYTCADAAPLHATRYCYMHADTAPLYTTHICAVNPRRIATRYLRAHHQLAPCCLIFIATRTAALLLPIYMHAIAAAPPTDCFHRVPAVINHAKACRYVSCHFPCLADQFSEGDSVSTAYTICEF